MTQLTHLSLTEAKKGLCQKKFSATELTQAFVDRIKAFSFLNTYITLMCEQALDQAADSDQRLARGEGRLLEGLPLGIKDLFCTKGVRTTAGSRVLDNFIPPYESTVTQHLLQEGAVFLGKTNMDEFAMGSSNLTSAYGGTLSPWCEQQEGEKQSFKPMVPGGSSGGSAAAVAAHLCLAATGSDTGGSVRQPAAYCGLVGIKPTYGLCSRQGMIAFASSLDQAGALCKTVEDAALMLQVMGGHDQGDATSLPGPHPLFFDNLQEGSLKGVTFGIPKEYVDPLPPLMKEVMARAMDWVRSCGGSLKEVSLPMTPYALPTYYIIAPAEASSNLARYDGVRYGLREPGDTLDQLYENTRGAGFGPEVQRRLMIGTYVLSAGHYDAYYRKAQRLRTLIAQDFDRAFEDVDLLLTPTTPTGAFPFDAPPTDPMTMYMNDIFTVTASLAGLPALSLPADLDDRGMPLGIQLVGPRLSEQKIFNAALTLETCADFSLKCQKGHFLSPASWAQRGREGVSS